MSRKSRALADANNNLNLYTYDGFDRLAQWNFPSKTTAQSPSSTDYEQYGYDAVGNRTFFRKRDGQLLAYTYDALNRMVSKGGAAPGVSYGYDLRGLQTSAAFTASGQGVANAYDAFGNITSTTSTMGGVSRTLSYQYDVRGNRTRITHPDGVYFATSFDALDRLTNASWWTPASGTVPFLAIGYDALGQRSDINRASSYTGYGYDAIGRRASQNQRFAGSAGNLTQTLGYNPATQIVSRGRDNDDYAFTSYGTASRSYAVNGLNQYISVGGAGYAYDANGNLTSDGSTTYAYDVENRLVSASGAHNVTLSYDPMGRLWRTSSSTLGKTDFLYDGDRLAAEYDGDTGSMRRRYMFAGEDEPILWDEGASLNCSGTKVLHTDQQGSVIALADCSGNRTNVDSYDEWGVPGGSNVGRFQYTGQAWIPELGMDYYKARIYAPQLGRFLQTDPIGYKDQINLYTYVANDPVNNDDPSGTCTGSLISSAGGECMGGGYISGAGGSEIYHQAANQSADQAAGCTACHAKGTVTPLSTPSGDDIVVTAKAVARAVNGAANKLRQAYIETNPLTLIEVAGIRWIITAASSNDGQRGSKTPNTGKPGSKHVNPGSGQERDYGDDGLPSRDVDRDHDHGQGIPHAHDWGRDEKGRPVRGPGRPLTDDE